MSYRQIARLTINIIALVLGILALPEFGKVVPVEWLAVIAPIVAALNQLLSYLKKWFPEEV